MTLRAVILTAALACAGAAGAREIGPDGLDRLPEVDVIVLGEVHDNPVHHVHQARAVRAIVPEYVNDAEPDPPEKSSGENGVIG